MRLYYIDESEGPSFYVRTALLGRRAVERPVPRRPRRAARASRPIRRPRRPGASRLPPHIGFGAGPAGPGTAPTRQCAPIKPWVARLQSSSITTGSILIHQEGRSCPISPDPVHRIDMRNVGIVEWALKCSFPARINYRSSTLDVNGVQCQ